MTVEKKMGNAVYIIAELSANHNQDLNIALKTIEAAKLAGADAIKLQTFTPDTLTINCSNEYFTNLLNGTIWEGKSFYELYTEASMPWEWQEELFSYANRLEIDIFSTPFDKSSVDFLEKFNPKYYKIASFEILDIPLIEYTASKGRPMIISTGIAQLADIEFAIDACRKMGNFNITVLKCTSAYPAPIEEANLRTIPNMRETFGIDVGLSDHTEGASAAIASVALGATMIEKHFILDRKVGGPDAHFSMEPESFRAMTKSIREVEKALGQVSYNLTASAKNNRKFARSIFVVKDVAKGEPLTEENIRSIRPGYGMHPKYFHLVLNKTFSQDISRGTPLTWDLIG
jgi:pseudaminic acid synthase